MRSTAEETTEVSLKIKSTPCWIMSLWSLKKRETFQQYAMVSSASTWLIWKQLYIAAPQEQKL